ncbi:hypothetical protein O53_1438 [Microcystis aeruginosa TAIHU98]|uniref:TIGR04376 family protein n=1 Tax=Microcystis aeruginosa TAIHU98 TaxID=1134457 RepID=L7EDN4_MICAE|nr:TIGR04376 family protein [Microcystis aeruginosa]ELP56828.1 hypothetical protein O53_1438 [Microcystis aeruginosa TAIHU98]
MGNLFDDVSRFLETQLEEFLKSHPQLELQALVEQLREQERDTAKLISALENERQRLEQQILATAQDIQTWHARIDKAKAAGRQDLVKAASEREAALFRQGNQLWGRMEGVKKRLTQSQELLQQIQQRRQEVQIKAEKVPKNQSRDWETTFWDQPQESDYQRSNYDNLDLKFKEWEMEEELKKLKREMGR